MEPERRYRFLLLDFGHPMSINTTENVKKSLKNALALGLFFRQSVGFGISILNSNFATFHSEINQRSYTFTTTNLDAQLKSMNISCKITVQEYKHLLSKSIEAVLFEFQKIMKYNSQCVIEIAVITKKTATLLADILKEVTKNLQKIIPNIHSIQKYKIVQILAKKQEIGFPRENSSVECTSCIDNIQALNCFFKYWLLNPQQQLRIILSEDPDFGIECEIDDCVLNKLGEFDSLSEFCSAGLKGTPKPAHRLKIINRLPVGLNPTFVFGIPRHVSASRSPALSWTESQNNSKIFKELCRELNQTEQGLLTKKMHPAEESNLTTFHFLSSDGHALLLTEVSPDELDLTKEDDPSQPDDFCEDAASFVKGCLKKVQYLDEYAARNFSSGLYDHLRRVLARQNQNKNFSLHPNINAFGRITQNEENPKALSSRKRNAEESSGQARRRQKTQEEDVHPALLSPNVVEKYRKVQSNAFNLPELSLNYNDNK